MRCVTYYSKLLKCGWCKRIGRSKNDKAKINKRTPVDDKPNKKSKEIVELMLNQ